MSRRNLIKTPWAAGYGSQRQAQIYRNPGGKIAVQLVMGYGGKPGNPSITAANAPIYYRTVLGAFDRLESAGFGDVVTIDQIVGVLNGAAPCPD